MDREFEYKLSDDKIIKLFGIDLLVCTREYTLNNIINMAEITDVANAIFKFKNDWIYNKEGDRISDEDKIKFHFIFNRYFSKKYLQKAQLLNLKTIDKATAMDLWFHFMKTQPYPDWFWSKSPKQEKAMPEKEYKQLLRHLKIKEFDLDYLIDKYPDFIKEEQTYLKKLEKGN